MGYPRIYQNVISGSSVTFTSAGGLSRSIYSKSHGTSIGNSKWRECDMKESHGWKLIFEEADAEPDTAHHAPSPTTAQAATDECLARHADLDTYKNVCERYAATLEKTAGEALTKRERFAMECLKSIMAGRSITTIDILAKDEGGAQAGACRAAVKLADHLIAELAKGRK